MFFTRDHMQGNFIPKNLKLPEPKPVPLNLGQRHLQRDLHVVSMCSCSAWCRAHAGPTNHKELHHVEGGGGGGGLGPLWHHTTEQNTAQHHTTVQHHTVPHVQQCCSPLQRKDGCVAFYPGCVHLTPSLLVQDSLCQFCSCSHGHLSAIFVSH